MPRDDDDKYFDPTKIVIRDREGNVRDPSKTHFRSVVISCDSISEGGSPRMPTPTAVS